MSLESIRKKYNLVINLPDFHEQLSYPITSLQNDPMIDKMDETKKEGNEEKEEGKVSNEAGASKFGLTSAGTVVMDGENDFCLQYFRSMECWKRPVQGSGHSKLYSKKQFP